MAAPKKGEKRTLTLADFNPKEGMHRAMRVGEISKDARTVELSFSSDAEITRRYGIEILDHSPGAVILDRMRNAASLLVDHNWSDLVGVIESAEVTAGKGRCVARFGKSARAEEIFADVQDRIRQLVSVGYIVRDFKLIEERDGEPVYLITRWEPYEVSFVSVPADTTVGVGRAMENPQEEGAGGPAQNGTVRVTTEPKTEGIDVKEKILRNAAGDLVRAKVDDAGAIVETLEVLEKAGAERAAGSDGERSRSKDILELGEKFGFRELAAKAVSEGKSVAEFQRSLLDESQKRTQKPLGEQSAATNVGMTDDEVERYSFMRAIRALANPNDRALVAAAAFEFDASRAAAEKAGKSARGIMIPTDVLTRRPNRGDQRAFNAGSQASGGILVDTTFMAGSFIEMLRKRTTIMRLGTPMGGLVGNVDIPKQTSGATGYWLGEGDNATEGAPGLGQISLTPKTVAAYTDITRRLSMQSTPDAEGIVRRDLNNALAQTIDYAGYYGEGANNQPRGLKLYTGINAVDFAAAGHPTFAELVAMETAVAADDADVDQMAYVMSATMRGWLKTTPKFGAGTEATIWERGGTVNGYQAAITNQVATADAFFGNFADLIIGMWGGLDLTVDPYSLSKSGGLRIVVFQDVDFALRRVESICWGSDAVA